MYEYVQTAEGWVLCWGGAALYTASRPPSCRPGTTERRRARMRPRPSR